MKFSSVSIVLAILYVFVKLDSKVMVIIAIIKMSVDEEVITVTSLPIAMTRWDLLSVDALKDLKEMVEYVTISTNVKRELTRVTNMASAKIHWDHMPAAVWMATKVTVKHASILIHAVQILVTI